MRYIAVGWSGYVPEICRHRTIGVPINLRWAFWGSPNRFLQRMRDANVEVMMAGPLGSKSGDPGITDAGQLDAIPDRYDGSIMTDDIEKSVLRRCGGGRANNHAVLRFRNAPDFPIFDTLRYRVSCRGCHLPLTERDK